MTVSCIGRSEIQQGSGASFYPIQTSQILRLRPPKSYEVLKFFISFVTTVKSRHAPTT